MKTSIIILTHNKLDLTKMCIESIREYTQPESYEIIVVDNQSSDNTVPWLKQQQDIRLILNSDNKGFPAGCNQGIEIATGDNILLLNNDVIVTHNWLDNLLTCLYSAEDIGAVGPVTNYCAYYQSIQVPYNSIEQMHQFASTYNLLDPNQWEERLKLIGYCMLIKTEVVRKIGPLDEIYSPGNFEDDDYSVRIRHAGYRLIFCNDTFIHHFGSMSWRDNVDRFNKLLHENEQKFEQKWGYNSSQHMLIHNDLTQMIQLPRQSDFSILEIGCGAGGTLLKIKNEYRNAKLYGIEPNSFAAKEAESFADILVTSIEDCEWNFQEKYFDFILLPNVLETIQSPVEFLKKITQFLKPEGKILASVNNLSHYIVIFKILNNDRLYNADGIRYYSFNDIEDMFRRSGLSLLQISGQTRITDQDRSFVDHLKTLMQSHENKYYEVAQWVIEAKVSSSELVSLLKDLQRDHNIPQILESLNRFSTSEIIQTLLSVFGKDIELSNKIASLNFMHQYFDAVIPYLNEALKINPKHVDTLYNYGYVLQSIEQYELALKYLGLIDEPDQVALDLIDTIEGALYGKLQSEQELKFLLHRIEFNVDQELTLQQIVNLMSNNKLSLKTVIEASKIHNVSPTSVLNAIAVTCYHSRYTEPVIPLLEAALELEPTHMDTLFNLGYVLSDLGQSQLALKFLKLIPDESQEVQLLIDKIEREQIS